MSIKEKDILDVIKRNNQYFEDYITRSVYHSNAIEGSTLSYYDTYEIIFNGGSLVPLKEIKPREIYEAINLKYAMDYIFKHIEDEVSATLVIDIAKIINKNINEIDTFRKNQVFIRGAEHIPPAAADVPRLINELLYSLPSTMVNTEELASFHIKYERIHPFSDGNGRSGRVLLNLLALKNGMPPFVISKENRERYMDCLANCDALQMAKLIDEQMKKEIERMDSFGIDFYKYNVEIHNKR